APVCLIHGKEAAHADRAMAIEQDKWDVPRADEHFVEIGVEMAIEETDRVDLPDDLILRASGAQRLAMLLGSRFNPQLGIAHWRGERPQRIHHVQRKVSTASGGLVPARLARLRSKLVNCVAPRAPIK